MSTNLIPADELLFQKYPEARNNAPQFVIHEHNAIHAGMHYDLRLQWGFILKSWVLHFPPLFQQENEQIFALPVADHPLECLKIEGTFFSFGLLRSEIIRRWDYGSIKWIEKSGLTYKFFLLVS